MQQIITQDGLGFTGFNRDPFHIEAHHKQGKTLWKINLDYKNGDEGNTHEDFIAFSTFAKTIDLEKLYEDRFSPKIYIVEAELED
jgi:hypothetical protein